MTQDSREKIDDWERFREFLLVLARVQTGTRWRGKLDLSGVVQQTLLEAYQAGRRLADVTDRQKAAWLKQVLTHNLADEVRKLTAARRDAGREAARWRRKWLSRCRGWSDYSPMGSPLRAGRPFIKNVCSRWPKCCLLCPRANAVLELHFLEERSVAEVAEMLATTPPAVAGLLHRGLKKLRHLLTEEGVAE